MNESMSRKEKTKRLVEDGCSMKEYMKMNSVYDSRELFRIRTSMNEIRRNFSSDWERKGKSIKCGACVQEDEVNSHIKMCPKYENLRRGLDLGQNRDIISYFRAVIRLRLDQENKL